MPVRSPTEGKVRSRQATSQVRLALSDLGRHQVEALFAVVWIRYVKKITRGTRGNPLRESGGERDNRVSIGALAKVDPGIWPRAFITPRHRQVGVRRFDVRINHGLSHQRAKTIAVDLVSAIGPVDVAMTAVSVE